MVTQTMSQSSAAAGIAQQLRQLPVGTSLVINGVHTFRLEPDRVLLNQTCQATVEQAARRLCNIKSDPERLKNFEDARIIAEEFFDDARRKSLEFRGDEVLRLLVRVAWLEGELLGRCEELCELRDTLHREDLRSMVEELQPA